MFNILTDGRTDGRTDRDRQTKIMTLKGNNLTNFIPINI